MSVLELSANFLTAALWPIVVLVLGLVYRDTIRAVLKRLTKLDAFGVTAELGKQLERLDESADRVAAEDQATKEPDKLDGKSSQIVHELPLRNLVEVARLSPSAAIADAWREVEARLRSYFDEVKLVKGLPKSSRAETPGQILQTLSDVQMISPDQRKLIDELRMTRNSIAHGGENPTEGQSLAFVDAAALAVQTLASDKWAIEKGEH